MSNVAYLDGVPFRVAPTKVAWPYSIKLATHKTLGGKVVQLYGVSLGDLIVEGTFGAGGPKEQLAFFNRILAIVDSQMKVGPNERPRPARFFWPNRGWDFWCYVKGIVQQGASTAIMARNDIYAPTYRLTLFIQEDNGDIINAARESAAASYIGRITKGMGWERSEWNGPLGFQEVQSTLTDGTILDDLFTKGTVSPGAGSAGRD